MSIQSPPRNFTQNGTFFLPFLSPTVTPSHDDSDPYHELLFVPFQPPTKIDLGTCRLGQSTSCKLNIFNPKDEPLTALLADTPANCPIQVETIRLPISECDTSMSKCRIYHLPPNSSALLHITWTPTFTEDLYYSLTFMWGSKFTSKVSLSGKVEDIAVKSRRVLFGAGVTKNLSSSFRVPLRSVTLNSPCADKPLIQLHPLATPTPSQAFLETAGDTSIASLPSTSFIASTPMSRNVTRPLNTEQSFVKPSAIKRPHPLNGGQGAKKVLPFSVAGAGKFDSEWAEKQSRAFTHWLNYVLTPPDSSNFSASLQCEGSPASRRSVLNLTTTFRGSPPLSSPSEAEAEPQYSLTQRKYLFRLRDKMQELSKGAGLTATLYQLHAEVDKARLKIRPERPVWKDVGLKEDLLHSLLSYHPLWLRLGLEAVFTCRVPVSHEMDSRMLKKFLSNNLVTSGDVSSKFSHRKVPGLFTKGYEQAIGKHITFKFFALVLFLDMAKRQKLIDHDPCLFLKNSRMKCSREMLLYFSRSFLQGEGDITKHLNNLGYQVSHKQSFLEEFDYKVTNLATDLRDGIRLSRLLELLTQNWNLSEKLRIPATSLTPRLANNKLFLDRLKELLHFPLDVTNKDLSIGHKEKTLSLIWALIFHFRVSVKIDEMLLRREISYIRTKHCIQENCIPFKLFGSDERGQFDSDTLQLLLEWCGVIGHVFGLRVTDFTSGFQDGRALCYIVHYYHPCLLSKHLISADAKSNLDLFCDKMSSLGGIPSLPPSSDFHQTGPNEKVVVMYVAYLCAQQLELREEIRAAIAIQRAFRRHLLLREQTVINQISYDSQLDLFHSQTEAATTIQAHFRGAVARANFRVLKHRESLISELSFQIVSSFFEDEVASALYETTPQIILERQRRESSVQHALNKIKSIMSESSVSLIQGSFRGYHSKAKKNGISLLCISNEVANSAITEAVRRLEQERLNADASQEDLAKEQVSNNERIERYALEVVGRSLIQSGHEVSAQREAAATSIQYWYREQSSRKKLVQRTRNARFLDSQAGSIVYGVLSSSINTVTRSRIRAATAVQIHYRRFITAKACRREFLLMRQSAVFLQSAVRNVFERKRNYQFFSALSFHIADLALAQSLRSIARNNAALLIQAWYRVRLSVRRYRRLHESRSAAARTIQRAFRSHSRVVACRREYLEIKYASIAIQRCFKHYLSAKRDNEQLLVVSASRFVTQSLADAVYILGREREIAALTIQTFYRRHRCARELHALRLRDTAACRIQLAFRSYLISISTRGKFLRLKRSTLLIQRSFRTYLLRVERSVSALNFLSGQIVSRALFHSLEQLISERRHRAALSVQSWYRMVSCRLRYHRELIEKKSAVLFFQQTFRNSRATALCRTDFLSLRESTILIQRAFRRLMVQKQQNCLFLDRLATSIVQDSLVDSHSTVLADRTQAARCIQCWYWKAQRQKASSALKRKIRSQNLETFESFVQNIVSRAFLNSTNLLLESRRELQAALTIQSMYRGLCVRRKIQNTSLLNVKQRLDEATNSAQASQQLRNKIPRYIDILLNARSLEQKYNILDKLKGAVYVSESCAIKLRQEGLTVLYMLVDNNVRSPSIIQRVEKAADVILQLAKWPSISKDVFLHGQSIPIITDVLQKIHATQPSTVRILSRLLIQFCTYPDQMALMHTYHHSSILKIHKCLMTLKRKYAVGSKRMAVKARKDLAQSIYELEAVFTHFRYAN